MNQKVFVNRILNLKKIKWIGLDMDHTLIRYHSKNFEALVYQLVIEHLITKKNYPPAIRTFKFIFHDAIRGLVIDCKNGNILKLSRYGAIRLSYHGTKQITFNEQKKIYRSVYVDLNEPNYEVIDTAFSIALCVLYGQLVDLKDEFPEKLPSYEEISRDVLTSVNIVHSDASLKRYISEDLERYVIKDQSVVDGLKHFIRHGKKIFILTNSDYFYTKILLDYAINPFLEKGETWANLFEYVITAACKPRFFYDNLPFLRINLENGSMTNVPNCIEQGVYQGGGARRFTENLGLNGDEILYIGDHIYGDILRLKKDCNWRTALVVDELGEEIASQKKAAEVEKKIIAAMEIKKDLEQQYIEFCTRSIDESSALYKNDIRKLQQMILGVDSDISQLLQKERDFYNSKWGRVFRAGAEESYFAYQVERFACIYMEKLADLLENSPMIYFRANRRLLPHDLDFSK